MYVCRGSDISFGLGAIWWYVLHILHARLSLEPLLVHRQRKKFQNIASADHCGTGICWYIQPDQGLLNAFQLNGPWPWFWQCSVGRNLFSGLNTYFQYLVWKRNIRSLALNLRYTTSVEAAVPNWLIQVIWMQFDCPPVIPITHTMPEHRWPWSPPSKRLWFRPICLIKIP